MKKEKEYEEHIKDCWAFAQRIVKEISTQENKDQPMNLEFTIFEKCISPHHYFIQNDEQGPSPQPPTEKQLEFAKKLEIQDPEKFSKDELSKKIDETLKSKRT